MKNLLIQIQKMMLFNLAWLIQSGHCGDFPHFQKYLNQLITTL